MGDAEKQFEKTIANNLRMYRRNSNMSQQELANKLGITQAAIARYEAGITVPNAYLLLRYAEIFDISLDELFDRKDVASKPRSKDAEFDHLLAKALSEGSESRKKIEELLKKNK